MSTAIIAMIAALWFILQALIYVFTAANVPGQVSAIILFVYCLGCGLVLLHFGGVF